MSIKAPKILIIADAQHGKDEVAALMSQNLVLDYVSTSMIVCEVAVLPVLGPKYGFRSAEHCYAQRSYHRAEWKQLIDDYVRDNPTALVDRVLAVNDFYVGLRNRVQLEAVRAKGLFDLVVWVDAANRRWGLPSDTTNELTPDDADIIIPNNGSKEDLVARVQRLCLALFTAEAAA